tara:strand:+ start:2802 stop:4103 length:1302 start_codon:yes stop_codon:yes gene_type:complete
MVTILFLAWTLGSVLLTLNVFSPLAKRKISSFPAILFSYFAGWLIGDLLPQWILLNIGILLFFSFYDIFSHPIGWGGLAVHLIGWFVLLLRLWVIFNLPQRLEKKMEQQLGNSWNNATSNFRPPGSMQEINWHSWLNPNVVFDDPRIEIIVDQEFYQENDLKLKLDIYRPKGSKKFLPGILQIHGGGWISGSKKQAALLMSQMAVQGWVSFSVTHKLSPEIVFPEHLIDIKRSLQWIKKNADKYGVDPEFIVTMGGSAGGHLASLMALTQNQPVFQPGFEISDTSIQGCVSLYGVYEFIEPFNDESIYPAKAKLLKIICGGIPDTKPESYYQITPANWISNDSPPFLLIQGDTDALISTNEAKKFFNILKSRNIQDCAILNLPLVEHAFDIFPTLTAQCIVPTIERYLIMIHENYILKKVQDENSKKTNLKTA